MNYLAYHFKVKPPQPGSDILIALISDFGFESFDQNESGFTAYIQEDKDQEVNLENMKFEDFDFSYQIEEIKPVNWNAEWEKNFNPVLVDDLLCIRAPFHDKNLQVKHDIVIMPKMSFGTGHHQTTRLMCRQMFGIDFLNQRVLDMGCGTGILAILAKLLGARQVLGVDIDDWCVENAAENCKVNGCETIIIKKGDAITLEREEPFDSILANINKNILKAQLKTYSNKLTHKGLLFLSGFFKTDENELKKHAEEVGFSFLNSDSENEWSVLVFSKN